MNLPSASLLGTGRYLQEADCALLIPPALQSALTKQPVENRYPRWNPGDTEAVNAKAVAAQVDGCLWYHSEHHSLLLLSIWNWKDHL